MQVWNRAWSKGGFYRCLALDIRICNPRPGNLGLGIGIVLWELRTWWVDFSISFCLSTVPLQPIIGFHIVFYPCYGTHWEDHCLGICPYPSSISVSLSCGEDKMYHLRLCVTERDTERCIDYITQDDDQRPKHVVVPNCWDRGKRSVLYWIWEEGAWRE